MMHRTWKPTEHGSGEYLNRDGYRAEIQSDPSGVVLWTVHDKNAGGTILLIGYGREMSAEAAKREATRFINRRAKR